MVISIMKLKAPYIHDPSINTGIVTKMRCSHAIAIVSQFSIASPIFVINTLIFKQHGNNSKPFWLECT